jgi:serine/threonine-protein kinase HipA
MTRRFDRTPDGDKLHMQSLGAMAHFDYRQPAGYSYEQAIQVIRRLELPREDLEQMVLRAFFNVVARNCDDHVKNIAFLMDRKGVWRLAPAFDVTYAWNPRGEWTSRHQMSIGGLRHGFSRHELLEFALFADVKKAPAEAMLDRILEVTGRWPEFADRAGVEPERIEEVQRNQVRTI